MTVYDIYTDLDPDQLGNVAAETYYRWLEFSLGATDIGGKTLKHPSGRYAAALSWRATGRSVVSIIADESVANEVGIIENGSPAIDLKAKMLGGGKAKRGKDGYLYRTLYLRPDQWRDKPVLGLDSIVSAFGGEQLRAKLNRLWAQPRPHGDPKSRGPFTMTNKPGSSPWRIPAMPAYAPAAILAQELQSKYGRR